MQPLLLLPSALTLTGEITALAQDKIYFNIQIYYNIHWRANKF
jgi:hypothetical protein